MVNILLTSVGRRSYLVKYFKEALKGRGKVICANLYPDTPAMYEADVAVCVKPAWHEDYIDEIAELCLRYEVTLLCSLHDIDTFYLSKHHDFFRRSGTTALMPTAEWARIALDKYECAEVLRKHGLAVPWTGVVLDEALSALASGELEYPVILKDRFGFGSSGLTVCKSDKELWRSYRLMETGRVAPYDGAASTPRGGAVVIQQAVRGAEYCIDIVNDLTGAYATHLVCEVHSMRAGESDAATTMEPGLAGDMPQRLSALTSHKGVWGLDCLSDDGVLRIIDVNPRFTGDYPFHHLAGANIPAALVAWATGQQVAPEWLRSKAGISGYKDLVPTVAAASGSLISQGASGRPAAGSASPDATA